MAVGQEPDYLGLDKVGVLVFIHQDVAEAAGHFVPCLWRLG